MNSNNTKTLIITQGLAARLLSTAVALKDTTADNVNIASTEGFKISHDHSEYGQQLLLVDRLNGNLFSVSFAGHPEFLELIGSIGWTSCAEALQNYLVLENGDLELDLSELHFVELGDKFVVYYHDAEYVRVDLLEEQLLGKPQVEVEAPKTINERVAEIIDDVMPVIEEGLEEVVSRLNESVETAAAAAEETVTETVTETVSEEQPKEGLCERARRYFRRVPKRAKVALGGVAVGAVVGAGLLAARHFMGDTVADAVDAVV